MRRAFDPGAHERACWDRVAYLCRYAHAPLGDVLGLTARDADALMDALGGIVGKENNAK